MKRDLDLTEQDGLDALADHAVGKALEARTRYGPRLGADEMRSLIADPEVVRFPTRIDFDGTLLRPGEFGWAMPLGERPSDGYRLVLHDALANRPDDWPLCAAYHLVTINYLDVATSHEAERFGAALFGLTIEEYYRRLCTIADSLPNAVGDGGYVLPGELPESSNCC